jgi:hypothetical protein
MKVLLLGATGETGSDIVDGLLEDGSFVRFIPPIDIAFPRSNILYRKSQHSRARPQMLRRSQLCSLAVYEYYKETSMRLWQSS